MATFRYPVRGAPRRRDALGEPLLPFGDDPAARAVTVSAFVATMNGVLRVTPGEAWVRGEVGDWKVWSSGHAYFSLRDDRSTLAAMMWASDVARLPFAPEAGLRVLARGRAEVYGRSGKLSLVVSDLQPDGVGGLQLALEQLKARLRAEGLFDVSRKRPLPVLPRRIGVVSSRHGAAVRDVLKVLSVRFPNAHVTLYPVRVQGPGSGAEVARAIGAFSRTRGADVLIVARGGGSKEDLAAFDEEVVVRAVATCAIPVISAVGHEVDVSLTDLAADVRAATPSQAAELVVARRDDFERTLASRERDLGRAMRSRLAELRNEVLALSGDDALAGFASRVASARADARQTAQALLTAVRTLPNVFASRLASADARLRAWPGRAALPLEAERIRSAERAAAASVERRLAAAREALAGHAGRLSALDPLRVLARGYSVTYREGSAAPLVDASAVRAGDALRIRLARGEVRARAVGPEPSKGNEE